MRHVHGSVDRSKPRWESPTMTSPQRFINRMIVFLVLAALAVAFAYDIVLRIFLYNPVLNGLILGVLLVGIVYIFRRVIGIKPEIRWIEAFRTSQPGFSLQAAPRLLAPIASALGEQERRGPDHAAGDVGPLSAGQHQRPARRVPRHLALPDRPSDLSRPARHLLGPARDDRLGQPGDQRPVGRRGRRGRCSTSSRPGSRRRWRAWARRSARRCSVWPARWCWASSTCRRARRRTASTTRWRSGSPA